jgi:hypothetical protein
VHHAASLSDTDIVWITIIVLGLLSWLGERYRRFRAGLRQAAELKHQRRVELALAQRGRLWRRPGSTGDGEYEVPAAVVPLPPSAQPVTRVPGPCRHEKIVPVITLDGEHVRWVCNNPRCTAEFPASVAVYEGPA